MFDGQVAGHVLCWTDEALGTPEVSYWIGKEHVANAPGEEVEELILELRPVD